MSDKISLQWGFLYFLVAFILSASIAMIIAGVTILNELDMFRWTIDVKSLTPEIQSQINYKEMQGTVFLWGGLAFMIGGLVLTYAAYRRIR